MQYHSKEELELYIKELKSAIKDLEDAFYDFTKDSEYSQAKFLPSFKKNLKR